MSSTCERLERSTDADPYRALAIAVLQRAIDDATGRRMRFKGNEHGRQQLTQDARRWLLDGADGLLDYFDIDHDAMIAALNIQPENETIFDLAVAFVSEMNAGGRKVR